MKKQIIFAAVLGFATPSLFAGEVDASSVTTFSAGTPARAAEVNSTFGALIAAINDNAERISNLELAEPNNSVAGGTYQIRSINSEVAVGSNAQDGYQQNGPNSFANISNGSLAATLSFSNEGLSGTFVVDAGADKTYEANTPSNRFQDFSDSESESEQITYVQTGSTVSVTFPDDGDTFTVDFIVSGDGSVLLTRSFEAGDTTFNDGSTCEFSFMELLVGIRTE